MMNRYGIHLWKSNEVFLKVNSKFEESLCEENLK